MMTVKELIEKLKKFDQNLPVEVYQESHGEVWPITSINEFIAGEHIDFDLDKASVVLMVGERV